MIFLKNILGVMVTLLIIFGGATGTEVNAEEPESISEDLTRVDYCHDGKVFVGQPEESWLSGHSGHQADFLIENEGDKERCSGGDDDDNTSPVITLLGDNPLYLTVGDPYTDPGATANDKEEGDLTGDIVVVDGVVPGTPGTYYVTYTVEDEKGAKDEVTREVIVEEEGTLPQCSDGIDNDNDGKIDFPEDNNCRDANDNTEKSNGGGGGGGSSSNGGGGEVLGAFTGDAPTCGMYLNTYMKMGLDNNVDEVRKLQSFLNEQGISVPITGLFGPLTSEAVEKFQVNNRLKVLVPWRIYGFDENPTGYVFKLTRHTINDMVCPGSEAYPILP